MTYDQILICNIPMKPLPSLFSLFLGSQCWYPLLNTWRVPLAILSLYFYMCVCVCVFGSILKSFPPSLLHHTVCFTKEMVSLPSRWTGSTSCLPNENEYSHWCRGDRDRLSMIMKHERAWKWWTSIAWSQCESATTIRSSRMQRDWWSSSSSSTSTSTYIK